MSSGRLAVGRRLGEVPVDGVEAGKHLREGVGADREHRGKPDRRVHRVPAADPVPEAERVRRIDPELLDRLEVGRHRDHVPRDRALVAAKAVEEPLPRAPGVRHRLDRRKGLRGDDHERPLRVEVAERLDELRRVDVGDEPERRLAVAVGPQRLVRHRRPEVGAADADVDHRSDRLAGVASPLSRANLRRERGHPLEHVVHVADDVTAVDDERGGARHPQGDMERRPVLRPVDMLAAEHRVAPSGDTPLLRQREEEGDRLVRDAVLRQIGVDPDGLDGQPLDAARVVGEQLPQMHVPHRLVVPDECLPRGAVGERPGHVVSAAGGRVPSRRLARL